MMLRDLFAGALTLALLAGSAAHAADVVVETEDGEVRGITRVNPGTITAFGWDGSTITVKPLTAEGNPYVKEYHDIDRWVWRNVDTELTVSELRWDNGRWVVPSRPDAQVVVSRVDAEGYLLPALKAEVEVGPVNPYLTPATPADDNYRYIVAVGDVEPDVRSSYRIERARRIAHTVPRVPDWMVTKPAEQVLFVPNNEYLVRRDGVWIRMDAEGEEIARGKRGESWRVLYWTKYPEAVKTAAARYKVTEVDRYVVVREDDEIVAVYDYDGTPVESTAGKLEMKRYYFTPFEWEIIEPLHEVQLEVKGGVIVSDPDPDLEPQPSPSPGAGVGSRESD